LNAVSFQVTTEFGIAVAVEEVAEFVEPVVFVVVDEPLVPLVTRPTPPRPATTYETVRPLLSELAEENWQLYLVKVEMDGTEGDRSSLPLKYLTEESELFSLLRDKELADGRYRVYVQQEGAPRRLAREFVKSGNEFREVIRQDNGEETEQNDGAEIRRDAGTGLAATEVDEIDAAFERFERRTQFGSRVQPDADATPFARDPDATADQAAETAPYGDKLHDLATSAWRPYTHLAWTSLVALGLAAGRSRGKWDEEVDEAMEQSDSHLWKRAARWLIQLRKGGPH
jgi:hypothetical protein